MAWLLPRGLFAHCEEGAKPSGYETKMTASIMQVIVSNPDGLAPSLWFICKKGAKPSGRNVPGTTVGGAGHD